MYKIKGNFIKILLIFALMFININVLKADNNYSCKYTDNTNSETIYMFIIDGKKAEIRSIDNKIVGEYHVIDKDDLKKGCPSGPLYKYVTTVGKDSNLKFLYSTENKDSITQKWGFLTIASYVKTSGFKFDYITGINHDESNNGNTGGNNNNSEIEIDFDEVLSCDVLLGDDFLKLLSDGFLLLKIGAVILTIILSMIDYLKAATVADDDGRKKANKNIKTRIIVLVLILVLPTIIEFILTNFNIPGLTNHNPLCK